MAQEKLGLGSWAAYLYSVWQCELITRGESGIVSINDEKAVGER